MASTELPKPDVPRSSKVKKPFKRPFSVPIVSTFGECGIENPPSSFGSTNATQANANHVEKMVTESPGISTMAKVETPVDCTQVTRVKKKAKREKITEFKAPSTSVSSDIENKSQTISADGKSKPKKKRKAKDAGTPSASGDNSGSCMTLSLEKVEEAETSEKKKPVVQKKKLSELQVTESGDQTKSEVQPKNKKALVLRKPVRPMTDDEYDTMFDAVLKRVMWNNGEEVEIQLVIPDKGALETERTDMTQDKGSEEDDFEALSHHDEELHISNEKGKVECEMLEEAMDENAAAYDAENLVDQILYPESMELIQLQNEITPEVSENEESNQRKLVLLPPKQKKSGTVKKNQLPPKQLWTCTSGVKPAKRAKKKCKNKISKQLQMQSREIDSRGTWVQCVNGHCLKWRNLKDTNDPSILPERWTCDMNTEENYNSCDKPEEDFDESEHQDTFIYTHFTEGSIVWAKMVGYPWWPAMVEIDPDVGEYFEVDPNNPMLPIYYHVVFFDDKVSRAWVRTTNIKTYTGNGPEQTLVTAVVKGQQKHGKEVKAAERNAQEALSYPLKERLQKYSFSSRFHGAWGKVCEESNSQNDSQSQEVVLKLKKRHRARDRLIKDDDDNDLKAPALECRNDRDEVMDEVIVDSLELDIKMVDEILDNAEDILSSGGGVLDTMEDELFECDDGDSNFEPAPSLKKIKAKKSKKRNADEANQLSKKKRKKNMKHGSEDPAEKEMKTEKLKTDTIGETRNVPEDCKNEADFTVKAEHTEGSKCGDLENVQDDHISEGLDTPTEKIRRKKKIKTESRSAKKDQNDSNKFERDAQLTTKTEQRESSKWESNEAGKEQDKISKELASSYTPTEKKKRRKKQLKTERYEETCEEKVETTFTEGGKCGGLDAEKEPVHQLSKGKREKQQSGPEAQLERELNKPYDRKKTRTEDQRNVEQVATPGEQNLRQEDSNKDMCAVVDIPSAKNASVEDSQPSESQSLLLGPHPGDMILNRQSIEKELREEKLMKKGKKTKHGFAKKKEKTGIIQPSPVSILKDCPQTFENLERTVEKVEVAEFDLGDNDNEPNTEPGLALPTPNLSQAKTEENSDPFDVDELVQTSKSAKHVISENSDPFDADEGLEISTKVAGSSQDAESQPFEPLEE